MAARTNSVNNKGPLVGPCVQISMEITLFAAKSFLRAFRDWTLILGVARQLELALTRRSGSSRGLRQRTVPYGPPSSEKFTPKHEASQNIGNDAVVIEPDTVSSQNRCP